MEFLVKDHLEICRCCLSENDLVDVLQVGNSTAPSVNDVFEYFKVRILPDENKSRKLCMACIQKINDRRKRVQLAAQSQKVINTCIKMAREKMASEERNT